jgi:site-specific recombinase XerD
MLISLAIQDHLSQLGVGKRPATVETYRVSLRRFFSFLLHDKRFNESSLTAELTIDEAIEFIKTLRQMAPATIGNYMAAVSGFYRYLFSKHLIEADVSEHERLFSAFKQMRPRYSRLPHVPPDDIIEALIREAGSESESQARKKSQQDKERDRLSRQRNVALLMALRSSGMRIGEALGLRRGDMDYRTKSARVIGKGNKERIVYFDEKAWGAIQSYLHARHDGVGPRALAQNPVFARHDRRSGNKVYPITRQRVEQIFAELADRADIEPRPTPHWFRHWFATRILERSQNLAAVQDMLGHESPTTTRIYARVSTKRLQDIHKSAFDDKQDED